MERPILNTNLFDKYKTILQIDILLEDKSNLKEWNG